MSARSNRSDRSPAEHRSAEEEALKLLGPLDERRIPVYHLDEIAAVIRALDDAWTAAAPPDLLARLRAGSQRILIPGIIDELGELILLITAPAAVCAAFDDVQGRLDSHTEFGR